MELDELDLKLNSVYPGKVVRKDLLHRIKKGTNVPTFVLEFLLARFCASDDEEELEEGMQAVVETLQNSYVRPDEANAAQSKVATKGKHRFIDKISVRYVEKDKRHWATLENFGSNRIAINESFFQNNDRLLEGGIWAEVTVAFNEVEEDKYSFYIEAIRPIQLSRFNFDEYCEGRKQFTRDEWLDVILRSVGLEPARLNRRQQFHYLARMASLVEANYNYIELGPRGTGKSYFFSEFSPYATLISGGQSTKSTLFYNMARGKPGLVSFWDTVAFDEVAGIRIKDPDTIQIMKDYMANGRFSRGVEVIANAGLSFVGNLDLSINQIVNSRDHDLFQPMPKEFDLAVMDRFAAYIPGWEMPKTGSSYLTENYGFISDYLAEAFHHQCKHVNRYEEVNRKIKLGSAIEGRDEKGIKKTVCAFLKILHPHGEVTDTEFDEYVAYAIEARRRVKEQMNKRKPDDEFAKINLSFINADGKEKVVYCPESINAPATQNPSRKALDQSEETKETGNLPDTPPHIPASTIGAGLGVTVTMPEDGEPLPSVDPAAISELKEQYITIHDGDTGYSISSIVGPYLEGAKKVRVEDPFIRVSYQIQNFLRFCERCVCTETIHEITLVTNIEEKNPNFNFAEYRDRMETIKQSLLEFDVKLNVQLDADLHDRQIVIDNGWCIELGRGLDIYQKTEFYELGAFDEALRRCRGCRIHIYQKDKQ